jgi:PhzF family phenazine biosynthesis protein
MTMIQRRFKQVDVFTTVPYLGNPVAVVLDADGLTTEQMQRIACWTNLSETTFVCRPTHAEADYLLRIFNPVNEMAFAGHPTIGSAHAMLTAGFAPKRPGQLVQECGAGLVRLDTAHEGVRIALPKASLTGIDEASKRTLALALGADLVGTPLAVNLGITWLTAQVRSGELLRGLRPDMAAIAELSRHLGISGVTAFGMDEATVEVRSFAPHEGTPEDPVCGSGNGAVAYYLREQRGAIDYTAGQGRCMGRDGTITIAYDADGTIWLGGRAVTCIDGSITA